MNKIKAVLFVFLAIVVLITGILSLKQRFVKPKASGGNPILSFRTSGSVRANENFDLIAVVNPNNTEFSAFKLYIQYNPTQVELRDAGNVAQNFSSSYTLLTKTVNTSTNTIIIIGAKTGGIFSGANEQEIVRVAMKVKPNINQLGFSYGDQTRVGDNLVPNKENLEVVIGGNNTSGASLFFSTEKATANFARGENFDLDVYLDTKGNQVKAVHMVASYAELERNLTFQNTSDLSQNFIINPQSGFDQNFMARDFNTTNKTITIGLVVPTSNGQPVAVNGSRIKLGTIKLKVKNDATLGAIMPVGFLRDQSSVYNLQIQNILTETPSYSIGVDVNVTQTPITPTEVASPTITSALSPVPGSQVQFKFKFQGITKAPSAQLNTMNIKVTFVGGTLSQPLSHTITTVADVNGLWSWRGTIPGLPAGGYKVLVKGPKHIQKRVCESTPQETFPGTYDCDINGITIAATSGNAANLLDFSNITILVGDLPEQDGIVNSYDISLVTNNLNTNNAIADLNLDGVVNTQDYSLVIAALSVRSDER